MRRTVLVTFVASLLGLGLGAPPATAASNSSYAGGCNVATTPFSAPVFFVLSVSVVLYSTTPADNPVSATVVCEYYVNGDRIFTGTISGTAVIADAVVGRFDWGSQSDVVTICTIVDFTSDTTPTQSHCSADLYDEVGGVYDTVLDATGSADSVICPVLVSLAPGVPGVLDIDGEGDTDVAGMSFWNCPPYET